MIFRVGIKRPFPGERALTRPEVPVKGHRTSVADRLSRLLFMMGALESGCQVAPVRPRADVVRDSIAGEVAKGVDATRRQDIEAYMAQIPDGLTIQT